MASYSQTLADYLPPDTVGYVLELLEQHPTELTIVKDRTSKQGDYRPPQSGVRHHRITVNRGLNAYSFLITVIHELAHRETWVRHQRNVKPHGLQWKMQFQRLMAPILAKQVFPDVIVKALATYLINPKASSCSDANLHRVLAAFDPHPVIHLESLAIGSQFKFSNGRVFEKQRKKRTRYVCKEMRSNVLYLIHGLAQVEPIN